MTSQLHTSRRAFVASLFVAPAVIVTPGLLMPVRGWANSDIFRMSDSQLYSEWESGMYLESSAMSPDMWTARMEQRLNAVENEMTRRDRAGTVWLAS